jgi:hypothetical protein
MNEQQLAAAQPAAQDAEGENKAVRSFLMLYGQPGLTVGQMKKHMARSGFTSWPEWVETEPHGAHLTKAGAQLWIRHLFALEVATPAAPVQDLPFGVGGGLVAIKTLLSRDPCIHANTAIEMIDAILKEHPAAQPAVQEGRDWSLLEATQESLREHMAEINRLQKEIIEQCRIIAMGAEREDALRAEIKRLKTAQPGVEEG